MISSALVPQKPFLEFLPDGKTLKVHTYSPLFGIFGSGCSLM